MLIERKFEDRTTYSYENYVCPNCLRKLNECECRVFPPYYLLMIDAGIQEIIRELNGKGYKTIGSCESHYGLMSPNINIIFDRKYPFKIPDGFKHIKNGNGIAHEYDIKISKPDWEKEKKKYIDILKRWAKELPVLDSVE